MTFASGGDTLNFVTDAIRRSDIEWVHVRHEEVAGFASLLLHNPPPSSRSLLIFRSISNHGKRVRMPRDAQSSVTGPRQPGR
jgi:nicotinamidase-related amidase